MTHLRNFTVLISVIMAIYTIAALAADGWDFMTPYFQMLFSLKWQGHIAADFSFYLALSALWIAWREGFSAKGIFLAVIIGPLGMTVFAPYLLWAIVKSQGDPHRFLLGRTLSAQS